MIDTPRTDEILNGPYGAEWTGFPGFARQLERELAASQAGQAELLARLQERTESHLSASARDVQTIQRQTVELAKIKREREELWQEIAAAKHGDSGYAVLQELHERGLARWQALAEMLATALIDISAHDGPGFPHGTCCNIAGQALAAYEAAKAGGLPDPLAEAAKICAWKEDEDGNWYTACHQFMCFEHAPPNEQGYKFCHRCGNPINFIEFASPLDEQPGPA